MQEIEGINRVLKISSIIMVGLLLSILAGCGAPKPTDTVNGFLTSIQEGDFEKAGTYVKGGTDSLKTDNDSTVDEEFTMSMIEAISKNYKFEKPEEVSVNDDKAVVKVKITSVDFGDVMTSTMAEIMPLAFANAFEEQTPESEKAFEKLMENTVLKHLKSEDAAMATRTVKLTLKKNKDGEYKIVNDDSLTESIFANINQLEDMFGEEENDAASEEEAKKPEQTSEVISVIATDQKFDVNPINMNIEEVSFKKAMDVSEEEQNNISYWAEKEVGSEFNYLYVSYNAENTAEEDYDFSGIDQVVVFSDSQQEVLDGHLDFIDYDEDQDGAYYGQVKKHGEVGFVIDTDPSKVDKVRVVIGHSMKTNTYDGGTDEQIVEFDLTQK